MRTALPLPGVGAPARASMLAFAPQANPCSAGVQLSYLTSRSEEGLNSPG